MFFCRILPLPLIGSIQPASFGTEAHKLALLEVATLKKTVIHQLPNPESQVIGVTVDEKWIIWSEASRQPDFGDWTLYAYNRSNGTIKTVATAPTGADGQPLAGAFLLPKVDQDTVVWPEAQPGTPNIAIKSVNLVTGQSTTLTKAGLAPAISWPNVAWIEPTNEPSKQVVGASKGVITVQNLETGLKKTLLNPDTPLFFSIYKNSIVWVSGKGQELILTDLAETKQQIIATTSSSDTFQFPTMNDKLVAWSSYEKFGVWDRQQQKLIDFKVPVANELINGNAFMWISLSHEVTDKTSTKPDTSQFYYLIDSSVLPTTMLSSFFTL